MEKCRGCKEYRPKTVVLKLPDNSLMELCRQCGEVFHQKEGWELLQIIPEEEHEEGTEYDYPDNYFEPIPAH